MEEACASKVKVRKPENVRGLDAERQERVGIENMSKKREA